MIIITGASSGIGKETALLLAKNKCDLILLERRAKKLQKVAQECER